jgi:hypothetical protein
MLWGNNSSQYWGFDTAVQQASSFKRAPDLRVAQRALGRIEKSGKIVRASLNLETA